MNSNIKAGVISSIIATAFFIYFLEPILSWFGKILIALTNFIFTSYQDRLYAEIASGSIDYSFLILTLFYVAAMSFATGRLLYSVKTQLNKKYDWFPNKEVSIGKRKSSKAIYILLILVILAALFSVSSSYLKLKTISTFDQHIIVLKPHISEKKVDILKADFASMRNRHDYKKLIKEINELAESVNIKLPQNKLYPL